MDSGFAHRRMRALRSAAVRSSPRPLVRFLRRLNRRRARLRYGIAQRLRPVEVSGREVADALREGGLKQGDGVFFQAAMSSFGRIDGGADAVLRALEDVLGPGALVAMPAFPFQGGAAEHLDGDPVFDVRVTPSAMGAVSERFRQLPGTVRSLHPTHSVCARGPGADSLIADHDRAATPFGHGTPFARMVERGMWQVWFGTDVHAFTIYHTFECFLGERFPIRVFRDEPVSARCVDLTGTERIVDTLVHDPAISRYRVRSESRWEVRRELLSSGVMRSMRLGKGEILMARMPEMLEALQRLLGRGVTIYDIELGRSPWD
jgi:aminoglycoside 3-N-acetyltransferase